MYKRQPVQCCSTVVPEYPLTVVEVSAAASFTDAFGLADDVLAVHAPLDIRRARALERGMSADDFEARSSVQPCDDELIAMACHVIDNSAGDDSLFVRLDEWIEERGITGLDGAGTHA